MAYSNIDKPSDYFQSVAYSGNGSTQNITSLDFQPDWIWTKQRDGGNDHQWIDSIRGNTKALSSNRNDLNTFNDGVTAFNSNGYSLSDNSRYNGSGLEYVSWNWLANSSSASNTSGSLASTVRANTTSGFSLVSYTSDGGAETVGHGLGGVPEFYIIKERSSDGDDWFAYHVALGAGKKIRLNGTGAGETDTSIWQNTTPTSTVFSLQDDSGGVNQAAGRDYIGYFFRSIKGFSKVSSFNGNNSSDGTMVYLGFKPAWILIRDTTSQNTVGGSVATSWGIWDNARMPNNPLGNPIWANRDSNEDTRGNASSSNSGGSDGNGLGGFLFIDFLSNGFKCRTGASEINSSSTYAYYAIADSPLVTSDGVPTNAE